mmetsp:Transcript_21092/g.63459  ORF Transcript_21092/g.63459 Transcript_21092/m.63459 type:complete len:287 (+) Transcript_21092:1119-1979(+)
MYSDAQRVTHVGGGGSAGMSRWYSGAGAVASGSLGGQLRGGVHEGQGVTVVRVAACHQYPRLHGAQQLAEQHEVLVGQLLLLRRQVGRQSVQNAHHLPRRRRSLRVAGGLEEVRLQPVQHLVVQPLPLLVQVFEFGEGLLSEGKHAGALLFCEVNVLRSLDPLALIFPPLQRAHHVVVGYHELIHLGALQPHDAHAQRGDVADHARHPLFDMGQQVSCLGRELLAQAAPQVILEAPRRLLVAVPQPDQRHQVNDLLALGKPLLDQVVEVVLGVPGERRRLHVAVCG